MGQEGFREKGRGMQAREGRCHVMRHVFIVGSKGIPGAYGGYETFVDRLTELHRENGGIKYHVACRGDRPGESEYHGARCFRVRVPDIGPAQAVYYDLAALRQCCRYIRENGIEDPVVYILACRVGPFASYFRGKIHRLGGRLLINPDGHEWMRAKWSAPVRRYWKLSERMMVRHADLVVCDSRRMEDYIRETYRKYAPETAYIAYGADVGGEPAGEGAGRLEDWYREKGLERKGYYLVVGRFVPENNFEAMIREFMASGTERALAIVTTANGRLLERLEERLHFGGDARVRFVGTVYDRELLGGIRENAFAYIHGHEVGGTNPSLLEAMARTDVNLLLDVGFNREVGQDAALYWGKERSGLAGLIRSVEEMGEGERRELGRKAGARIAEAYSWQGIADAYERVFTGDSGQNPGGRI